MQREEAQFEQRQGRQIALDDLLEAVKKLPEGSSIKLSIKRGDDSKDITVELGKGL